MISSVLEVRTDAAFDGNYDETRDLWERPGIAPANWGAGPDVDPGEGPGVGFSGGALNPVVATSEFREEIIGYPTLMTSVDQPTLPGDDDRAAHRDSGSWLSGDGTALDPVRSFDFALVQAISGQETLGELKPTLGPLLDSAPSVAPWESHDRVAWPSGNLLAAFGPYHGMGLILVGTDQADTLQGAGLADDIRGLAGNDLLKGLGGDDLLRGDAGCDTLSGGSGADHLIGGSGMDRLFGAAGDDFLYGGSGKDLLRDGAGRDILMGGQGADTFQFAVDGARDCVKDFGSGDRIDLSAWDLGYDDLHIADVGFGKVLVASATESLLVSGAHPASFDASDLDASRFVFDHGPTTDGLVFWNTFDSLDDLHNSKVGPDALLIGNHIAFEASEHGDGFVRTATDTRVEIPKEVLNGLFDEGTMELWVTPEVPNPVPYQYGVYGLVGNPYGNVFGQPPAIGNTNGPLVLAWGDEVSATGLLGGLQVSSSRSVYTPNEATQWVATPGDNIHVALVWDAQGIDNSSDTVRVYRDGEIVGVSQASWNTNMPYVDPNNIWLGYGPDGGGYDKFITDNVKIWDHAKTDFSDRFDETAGFHDPMGVL